LFDIKASVINKDYELGRYLSGLRYFGSRVKLGQDERGKTLKELDPTSKFYDSTRRYDIRASKLIFKPQGNHSRKDIKDIMLYAKGSLNLALYNANENARALKNIVDKIIAETKETEEYKNATAEEKKKIISDKVGHKKIQNLLTSKEARLEEKVKGNKELLNVINVMVNHVEQLGTILIEEGLVDGPLAAAIDANRGVYLHRKYKLYGKKAYSPTEDVRNKAILFIVSELKNKESNEGKSDKELYDIAKKKVDLILRRESGSLDFLSRGFGKVLTADSSIFKARNENLPEEIRNLLGEVNDPYNNYVTTVGKIAQTIASDRMYEDLLAIGLGDFISAPMQDNADLPEGESSRFSGNKLKGRKWGALEGYFVDNEMYAVMNSFDEAVMSAQNNGSIRAYLKLSLLGKKYKTIYSLGTHGRNIVGNTSFVFMAGHVPLNGEMYREAIDVIKFVWDEFRGNDKDAKMDAIYQRLVELGVVNTNAFLQEINSIINQLDESNFSLNEYYTESDDASGFKAFVKDKASRLDNILTKAYQAEDDVFKFFGWMVEKARYMRAGFPESLAERQAARNIRNTYPNYDEIPAFISTIGRFPLVGTFVAFQAETWRCSKNNIVLAREEMNSNNPELKKLGSQRMATTLASLALTETIQVSLAMLGYNGAVALLRAFSDDEEEEEFDMTLKNRDDFQLDKNIERILAEWDRNGHNILMEKGTMIDMDPKSPFYRREVPFIKYVNMSKMSGTGFIRDTFRVIYKGIEDPEGFESFTRVVKQIYEPFLSIDMTTDALLEVLENENGRIFSPSDDVEVKFLKALAFVGQKIGPSTLNQAGKMAEIALTKDTNRSLSVELLAMLGLRETMLLPYTSARFDYSDTYKKMKDLTKGEEGLVDQVTTPFVRREKFSLSNSSETRRRYRDQEDVLFDPKFEFYYRDMVKITKGLRSAGSRGVDILEIMTGPNVKMPSWLANDILNTADDELAN
jgi:hypothetical protein